ncbi:uncharacterized protein LOC130759748 isoform X1 [Actinidia eriantha]|uniref:uncharacterized protein LOC130759748 isoform X1 n=1 Tax=Actinidia eriantha TaxID=165200 RepID=UPI00258E9348|nr:uncharacterized protein LOC130759748 isoform X1 [Actinidia eriantha]
MAETEKGLGAAAASAAEGGEEEERLLEGMMVLDFDMLCSTVAMQTQGKWTKLDQCEDDFEHGGGELGGVLRMWEGELLDCFDDRRIALESACCPCYRFGKNMGRAGFGSCFVQGIVYLIIAAAALFNCIAFIVTKKNCFLYLGVAFTISVGTYLGFHRTQIRKKFNIRGSDSSLDDCVYHLICPCCTLCQESRTLDMNNVQDGTWHGRGDTICIGAYGEGSKASFELHPPPVVLTNSVDPGTVQISINVGDHSWDSEVGHCTAPLATQS